MRHEDVNQLLELEGARVENVAVVGFDVAIDFRFKGTDDGAMRVEFSLLDGGRVVPWNPEVGDFR